MKISDVYLNSINHTEEYSRAARDKSKQEIVREQFRIMARKSEELSSALAHCIALFGDFQVSEINFLELDTKAQEYWYLYTCSANSWRFGFEYLRYIATINKLPEARTEPAPFTEAWLNVP